MIRAYKYINTVHSTLHRSVISFFLKIKTGNDIFRDELFEPDFLPIVNRHRKILKNRFKIIYEYVLNLPQADREGFCQKVIDSNEIEKICRGEYIPEAFVDKPTGIDLTLKELFLDLYNQVLDGAPFQDNAKTTLREHFNQFCIENSDITLCPICGIGELKKSEDETRDQYDHYLPKALYPFSSVNFHNLVLCCKECNSFDAKGEKDTIAVSSGKFFFPYDDNHKDISLGVNVKNDHPEIEEIKWELVFSSSDDKNDEIESWKSIYSIEGRYQGYIKARVKKWYEHYYSFNKSTKLSHLPFDDKNACYMEYFELEGSLGLSYIRKPTLNGLISGSNIVKAEIEAMKYM